MILIKLILYINVLTRFVVLQIVFVFTQRVRRVMEWIKYTAIRSVKEIHRGNCSFHTDIQLFFSPLTWFDVI